MSGRRRVDPDDAADEDEAATKHIELQLEFLNKGDKRCLSPFSLGTTC